MMRRITLTLVIVALLGATGGLAEGEGARAPTCGSLSLGPGALTGHAGGGATCLLRAFQQHCRRAVYRLSVFGVDTVAVSTFATVGRAGHCEVALARTFRVVPQPPRPQGRGYCRTLRREGTAIVAEGCSGGGLPTRVYLTSPG